MDSCRGRCQIDRESCRSRMIGRISDTALAGKVDMLTGAFNAGKLTEDIAGILQVGSPCFLLLLGVDNLKNINIRHGRDYGNHLLQSVADTLEKCLDTGLRIYRLNGDCFAVNRLRPAGGKWSGFTSACATPCRTAARCPAAPWPITTTPMRMPAPSISMRRRPWTRPSGWERTRWHSFPRKTRGKALYH